MVDAAVADTHALVFHAARSRRLGKRAARVFAAAENRAAVVYVPVAVMWECALPARVGRIDIGRSLRDFFADQVYLADETRPNDDPFDALICAAAVHLELPLVTRDRDIEASGLVRVIW